MAPTESGNVILEWIQPKARIELEINFAEQKIELYATNMASKKFVEESFAQTQWAEAFSRVAGLLVA